MSQLCKNHRTQCVLTGFAALAVMSILILLLLYFTLASPATSYEWPPPSDSVMGTFSKYAVTTDNVLCTHIAKEIISNGGNAVEAAIGAMFCLGATNPQSSGLGGGFLMTLYNTTTGRCTAVDAREAAPALAHETMFLNDPDGAKYGFKAAGVPGELAGYWELFTRYGSGNIKWADLVTPTIQVIKKGVPVSPYLAETMRVKERHFRAFPSMKAWINPKTNATYKEGETLPREKLRRTLERIARSEDPVELFYRGEMAETIDREMSANGGFICKEDLERYRVRIHDALINDHLRGGLSVCGGPPPSGFAATQLIIALMGELYPNGTSKDIRQNARVYHDYAEAMKFAYAQRTLMGDVEFVPEAARLAKKMITKQYVADVRRKMTGKAQPDKYYLGDGKAVKNDFGTCHVSILDDKGNGVSATTTINRWFGAAVESEELGIIWNDEMDDFSTPGQANGFGFAPSETNFIRSGKRPMSSMSPLVVYDTNTKKIRMVAGASGGSKIISALSKTVVSTVYFGQTVKEAIDSPMFHNQYTPNIIQISDGFPLDLKADLENTYGQTFRNTTGFEGIVQAISVNGDGKITACGDYRRRTEQIPGGV